MVRHKIKKAVAIAMSAVIALTAVPNLPLQYEKKAEAATTEISSADVTSKYNKYLSSSNKKTHVSVHDPSIVIGYTDTKYTGNKSVKIKQEKKFILFLVRTELLHGRQIYRIGINLQII